MDRGLTRRGFLAGSGAAVAAVASGADATNTTQKKSTAVEIFLNPPVADKDYAYWSRECGELWGPVITKAGVQLVVCGHAHRFRYDPPTAKRPWAQVVGGGPELGVSGDKPDASRFPTVIEGKVEDGKLRLVVHDVMHGRVVFKEAFESSRM